MSKVFIVGAETLSVPAAATAFTEPNASRFQSVIDRLSFELNTLFHSGYMTALGCASDSSLVMFSNGTAPSLTPISGSVITQITPVITVTTANAIAGFSPDMIIDVTRGIAPSSTLLSAIATLRSSAVSAGIIWRDLNSIPSPTIKLFAYYKDPLATAVVSIKGQLLDYAQFPTSVSYSIDGASVLSSAVSTSGSFSVPVARLSIGVSRMLTVTDSANSSVSAIATIPF